MNEIGTFALGVGGMAWLSFNLSEEALVIIGAIGLAIGLFCSGYQWGKYKKDKQ